MKSIPCPQCNQTTENLYSSPCRSFTKFSRTNQKSLLFYKYSLHSTICQTMSRSQEYATVHRKLLPIWSLTSEQKQQTSQYMPTDKDLFTTQETDEGMRGRRILFPLDNQRKSPRDKESFKIKAIMFWRTMDLIASNTTFHTTQTHGGISLIQYTTGLLPPLSSQSYTEQNLLIFILQNLSMIHSTFHN